MTLCQTFVIGDTDLEHYWALPHFIGMDIAYPALPAIATTYVVGRLTARLDSGSDVCIASDRRAFGNKSGSASETKCSPTWIPEAASCLTMHEPVKQSINKWLVDIGCGYALASKKQADNVRRWIRRASTPRTFQSANGVTTADQVARMTSGMFNEEVPPYI